MNNSKTETESWIGNSQIVDGRLIFYALFIN